MRYIVICCWPVLGAGAIYLLGVPGAHRLPGKQLKRLDLQETPVAPRWSSLDEKLFSDLLDGVLSDSSPSFHSRSQRHGSPKFKCIKLFEPGCQYDHVVA